MNKNVCSKEKLLECAKKIALENSLEAISMRELAKQCNISVGAVYNYFPSKSGLMIAVVDDFWQSIFAHNTFDSNNCDCFMAFYKKVYKQLYEGLCVFKSNFLSELSVLSANAKQLGRNIENDYFDKMISAFIQALDKDEAIKSDIWSEVFTKNSFASFVLSNTILLLKKGTNDCSFFLDLLQRLLYNN